MIKVCIGNDCRVLAEVDANWIASGITGRMRDGQCVCVAVTIDSPGVQIALRTPGCGSSFNGGGRHANPAEQRILDLWARHHMDAREVKPGHLIAFLNQLER